ncbi:MAG TPA: hypothetical protein VN961_07440 [Streptosporangiaceae bacterium]|nr:hypothetical protein [Streptosporangiaceae bacterium]
MTPRRASLRESTSRCTCSRSALGLPLLDYLALEDLAAACHATGRRTFLSVIAPLRLPTGTGSPVYPIVLF